MVAAAKKPRLTAVTVVVGHRCPTCGEYPTDLRGSFDRRVDLLWVDPAQGIHFTSGADGTPQPYRPVEPGPAGFYSTVIVPRYYLGRVLRIIAADEVVPAQLPDPE